MRLVSYSIIISPFHLQFIEINSYNGLVELYCQGFLQDFTFWGGVEGLLGGSSLEVGAQGEYK